MRELRGRGEVEKNVGQNQVWGQIVESSRGPEERMEICRGTREHMGDFRVPAIAWDHE